MPLSDTQTTIAILLTQDTIATTANAAFATAYNNLVGPTAIAAASGVVTVAGSTTSAQSSTYSGSTAFTFTAVPASYNDYFVFRNGVLLTPTTDYTTVGNVITVPGTAGTDVITFRRIK